MSINNESFVLYESVFAQFERLENKLGKAVACDFMRAICEYGLYGVVPDDDSDLWLYGLEQTFTSIGKAKERYDAAKTNGKKGGRPKAAIDMDRVHQLLDEGYKTKDIAAQLGVSDSTIKRRLDSEKVMVQNSVQNFGSNQNPSFCSVQNLGSKLGSNQNLNVNVNVNENVNKNVNDNETVNVFSGSSLNREAFGDDDLYKRAIDMGF